MRVIIEAPEYLVQKVRELITSKRYSSISEFFVMSGENQLELEKNSSAVIDLGPSPSTKFQMLKISNYSSEQIEQITEVQNPENNKLVTYSSENGNQDWMWGQINRIFPIKLVSRLLLINYINANNIVDLEEFSTFASKEARMLGEKIAEKDAEFKRKRDGSFSTGLPTGKREEKALSRFANHFVGAIRKDGRISGALPSLKLADIQKQDGINTIVLTKGGIDFATIPNPIIDNNDFSNSLSNNEIEFFLNYIKNHVTVEYNAYMRILDIINQGHISRTSLNDMLQDEAGKFGWSEEMINTQRGGVMSRMYELHLIDKKKDGINVTYHLTNGGKNLLNN